MNIVELHYKTNFYMDSERSPRFSTSQVDKALNSAINDIVLDRYHNIRAQQRKYAFQTSQRLRDELYTLVKSATNISYSGDLVDISTIEGYRLLLALEVSISGKVINTIPLTYDELNVIELDPFSRPSINWPERVYRIESSEGVKIIWGDIGQLVLANGYYIKQPDIVLLGTEVSTPGTSFSGGTKIVAYVDSVINLSPGGSYNLPEGTVYTLSASTTATLTSGIVYKDYVDCNLPEILHEEVARKAAAILSGNVENYNKEKYLETDIKQTEN